uniref:Uncharacterized protein n=1 Tax=Heterorhabditis bacteriophora TaxID=37862 RepID=A0A1I7X625_HETBA
MSESLTRPFGRIAVISATSRVLPARNSPFSRSPRWTGVAFRWGLRNTHYRNDSVKYDFAD